MLGLFGRKYRPRCNTILGINKRNLDFIFASNERRFYPGADSKLATKRLAASVGVRTPKLIDVIEWQYDVKRIGDIVRHHSPCVLKPDHGSGGGGIVVIKDILPIGFQKSSGDVYSESDLRFQCQNILSGMYSLGQQRDIVLIEEAVQFDEVFNDIAFQGVPDVRIIVHHGTPVMGMLRLPTKASDGKANLHQGGLGVGIDMDTGQTTLAVQYNRYVERHPETGALLAGRTIPYWQDMLSIAHNMQQASRLGYIGVDIVLDKAQGPMVLEINARPGISIQIANGRGLLAATS
jgi:alpha-L-glutamate ligase-like protein